MVEIEVPKGYVMDSSCQRFDSNLFDINLNAIALLADKAAAALLE